MTNETKKRLSDSEIVQAFLENYRYQSTGTAWNWFVIKMDDEVREEFDRRIAEQNHTG